MLEDPSFENVLLHEMETLKQLCRESSVLNNMDILLLLTSRKISRWFLHVLIIVFDLEHCPGATVDFYNWVDEMGRRIFGCVHEYLLENQAELQLDPYELETVRMLTTAEAEFPGLRSDEPAEDFNPEMEEDED